MLLPFPITQYFCNKGLLGMFHVLLGTPFFPLTTADSLEPTSDCKPASRLEGDRPFLPFPVPCGQPDLTYSLDWSSVPALSGSKGRRWQELFRHLELERCWCWSWRGWRDPGLRGLPLSCSFSPSAFPTAALAVQGRARGCPAACPLHVAWPAGAKGQSWGFSAAQGNVGESNTASLIPAACRLFTAHATPLLQGKPCNLAQPPSCIFPCPIC